MMHSKMRLWVLALAALAAMPLVANAQTQQLPISAWLNVQPVGVSNWTTQSFDRVLYFDANGTVADFYDLNLGTTVEGSVKVRTLSDGKAQVTVTVLTRNAYCRGIELQEGVYQKVFGYTPGEILGGMPASLGDGLMKLDFIAPDPNEPIPPPSELGNDVYPLLSYHIAINCAGEMRNASGYPDGTPGAAHVTQEGLMKHLPAHCPGDCWPAEVVRFWATGRK